MLSTSTKPILAYKSTNVQLIKEMYLKYNIIKAQIQICYAAFRRISSTLLDIKTANPFGAVRQKG